MCLVVFSGVLLLQEVWWYGLLFLSFWTHSVFLMEIICCCLPGFYHRMSGDIFDVVNARILVTLAGNYALSLWILFRAMPRHFLGELAFIEMVCIICIAKQTPKRVSNKLPSCYHKLEMARAIFHYHQYFQLKKNCHINVQFNPSCPDPKQREKTNLNFYFHTSLWCLKRFYKGLKGTTKKCENINLN